MVEWYDAHGRTPDIYILTEPHGYLLSLHVVKCNYCEYGYSAYVNLLGMSDDGRIDYADCIQCGKTGGVEVYRYARDFRNTRMRDM